MDGIIRLSESDRKVTLKLVQRGGEYYVVRRAHVLLLAEKKGKSVAIWRRTAHSDFRRGRAARAKRHPVNPSTTFRGWNCGPALDTKLARKSRPRRRR